MQSNRLKRLLDLLSLLHAGHGANVQYLAETLECSQRTVFRDLDLLKSSGVELGFDDRVGGYTIHSDCGRSFSHLSNDEWLAILMAASVSSLSRSPLFAGAVSQAIAKLMTMAPKATCDRFNRLVRAVVNESELASLEISQLEILRLLIDAIDQRKRVRIELLDRNNASEMTVLSPYRTVYREGEWNAEGRSTLHGKPIVIPLRLIGQAEMLSQSFRVPVAFLRSGHTGGRALSAAVRCEPAWRDV